MVLPAKARDIVEDNEQERERSFFVTPKVGTQGLGMDLGSRISPKWGARLNANYFPYSRSDSFDDVKYDLDLTLATVGLLLDFHPFEGGFRITGGAYYNGNKLDLDADLKSGATYTIGDRTYTAEDIGSIDGDVTVNDFSPYLGLGWGTNIPTEGGSWAFSLDAGVMYHGSPSVSLSVENPNNIPQLDRDLNDEISEIESDIDYRFHPVLALGVSYRF